LGNPSFAQKRNVMKNLFLLVGLVLGVGRPVHAAIFSPQPGKRQISVRINTNVELLGLVYFLGYEGPALDSETDPEKRKRELEKYAYGYSLYQQYKPYAESKNLAVIAGMAGDMGIDYFTSLLVQLDDFPNATLREDIPASDYIQFSSTNQPEEARQNATRFIDAMNGLYREVNFDAYLRQHQKKYENALEQVKSGLPGDHFIAAMEKFYGQQFGSYTLVPSLTIPAGMGFGVRHQWEGKKHIFNVFGAFGPQAFRVGARLDMGFGDQRRLRELSTHEFGHSFVNPVIDQLPAALIAQTEKLYAPIRDEMTRQGYNDWKSCLYEHFVRAGEIIIAENLDNREDAERLRQDYVGNRKFLYLPLLVEELQKHKRGEVPSYPEAVGNAMKRLKLKTNAG
jgi:hypothetical protein